MDLSKYWDRPLNREVAQGIVDDVMAEIARLKAEVEADEARSAGVAETTEGRNQ